MDAIFFRRNFGTRRLSGPPSLRSVNAVACFHGGKVSGALKLSIQHPRVLGPQKDVS